MRNPARWAFAGAAVSIAIAVAAFDPRVFTGGDNAAYYALAEALASGRGYVDLVTPGHPAHTQYPPGFPLLLVPLHWLFDGSYPALKLASLLAAVGALAGVHALARRDRAVPAWAVAAAVPLVGLNPVFLDYSHRVLSDMAYLALVLLALTAFARSSGEPPGRGRGAWLAGLVLSAGAFYVRTAGVALLLAAVGAAAFRRQGGRTAAAAFGLVAAVAPWVFWTASRRPPETGGYVEQLLSANPYDPTGPIVSPIGLAATVVNNAGYYATVEFPSLMWPAGGVPPVAFRVLVLLVGGGLAVAGVGRAVRMRGVAVHDLYAIVTIAILVVWPFISDRFFLAITPVVWLYLLIGLDAGSRRLAGTHAPALFVAAAVAVALLVGGLARVPPTWAVVRAHLDGDELAGYDPFWQDYFEAARWIGREDPTAVIVARKPRLAWLWSGQPAFVFPFRVDPEGTWREFEEKGATHVLLDGLESTRMFLDPALQARRERLEVVHAGPSRAVLVLRIAPEREPTLLPPPSPE